MQKQACKLSTTLNINNNFRQDRKHVVHCKVNNNVSKINPDLRNKYL